MRAIVRSRGVMIVLLVFVCIALTGCSTTFEYVPEGAQYTFAEAEELASSAPLGSASDMKTSDANGVRQERLTELRGYGDAERALADALTRDFPADHAAVPLRIEAGTVDGKDAWIIIEAWGDKDATLTHKRLWVLDRATYAVIGSSSFR
ncbi:MAG: hypothetical protein WBI63_06540 [Coriobacteriia bacterium]